MQIPTDMHKWRSKFAWEMIGFAVLSLAMAAGMIATIWFSRGRWLANPAKLLAPTAGIAFAAAVLVGLSLTCIGISIRARRHDAKIKEMEQGRPPLTLDTLREELRPETLEQYRISILRTLETISPETRAYTEAKLPQLSARYRADLDSTPEVEMAIAKLEVFTEDVLHEASASRA